jgi:amino acid transporter
MPRKRVMRKKTAVEKRVPVKFKFSEIFSTSHFIMGFFAAVGVVAVSLYASKLFSFNAFGFVLAYLVIHLGLALDYYYERNIDERFLISFYVFSNIFFIVNFIFIISL